jgi:hypothetical protein
MSEFYSGSEKFLGQKKSLSQNIRLTEVIPYTVLPGDAAWVVGYANRSALVLGSASDRVLDSVGNAATLLLPAVGGAGSLDVSNRLSVPCQRVVSVRPASGFASANAGSAVDVEVPLVWSSAVWLYGEGGVPRLWLGVTTSSGVGAAAEWVSGNGTAVHVYRLSVSAGYWSRVLWYNSSEALVVPAGSSLVDTLGHGVLAGLPAPGSALALDRQNRVSIGAFSIVQRFIISCELSDFSFSHCFHSFNFQFELQWRNPQARVIFTTQTKAKIHGQAESDPPCTNWSFFVSCYFVKLWSHS